MTDNVVAFPTRRKSGRPRIRPSVTAREATILALPVRGPADKPADLECLLNDITWHLLQAARAIAAHDKKHRG